MRIDNTNRDIATRQFYVNVAERLGVPIRFVKSYCACCIILILLVRCFKFDGSAELAWHNNLYRAYNRAPSNAQDEVRFHHFAYVQSEMNLESRQNAKFFRMVPYPASPVRMKNRL